MAVLVLLAPFVHGLFPVDADWIRPGVFHRYAEPRPVMVGTARFDLRQQITAVAEVTLSLPDGEATLVATGGLGLLFHDATNGDSTASWRTVATSVPDENDAVIVDFNRSVNLPFAFTDFGTCPAPPAGNRLDTAVTAGERRPRSVL